MDCYSIGQSINSAIKKHNSLWYIYNPIYQITCRIPYVNSYVETIDICRDKEAVRNIEQAMKECAEGKATIVSQEGLKDYLESL